MRVLALLSGGKDSVAAIEVARNHGWDVAAALVLRPAEDDAWMFHTPNLHVARAVAECLGLPVREADVRSGAGQEVEDLEAAVAAAKAELGIDGIVSGALASEYQRTRLDAIGHRLGLRSFAPLWHKEPVAYMQAFVRGGWDIRFSRIAAGGIPHGWAGQRLDEAKLQALRGDRMRPHVAGEGGEFETLVLDAPSFTSRIEVDEAHVEATGSRATWVVDGFHLKRK